MKLTSNIIRTVVFVGAIAAVVVASAVYYRLAPSGETALGNGVFVIALADAHSDALFAGGLSGLAIIVVLVVLVHVVHRDISAPVWKLTRAAERITAGQLDGFAGKFADDEIGALARVLGELAKKTAQAQRLLRERVDEKTRALSEKVREVEQKNIALAETKRAIVNALDDLRAQETLLRQERDKLNVALRGIADGVFVIDRWEVVTFFNAAAEGISGYSASEIVGKPYQEILRFMREADGEIDLRFIDDALFGERVVRIHVSAPLLLLRKSGKQIVVAANAAPLRDERGETTGVVVVFRDVSHEREIDRAKSEFISLATHQLRTPLTTMKWIPEMLLEGAAGKLTPKQRGYVDDLRRSAERLVQLINKLLSIARIESRALKLSVEDVDLHALLAGVRGDFAMEAAERKQRLLVHAPKIATLRSDSRLLREVLHNLLANAIKYTPAGGHIELTALAAPHRKAAFTVKDDGIGIPAAQQSRIFSKFFRADNAAKTEVTGTGLGLYIVKKILEILGGDISFTSAEQRGTTFTFMLPLDGPPAPND